MKTVKIAFLLSFGMVHNFLLALSLSEVRVGGVYYHDEWNNNNRVKALSIHGNRVEIQYLEGPNIGEIDRVYPSDLLTKSDSDKEAAEDFGQGVAITAIGIAAVVCTFNPEACETDKKKDVYTPPPSTKKAKYLTCLSNDTTSNIYFNYRWGSSGNWEKITLKPNYHQWFSIPQNTGFELKFDNKPDEGYQEILYILDTSYSYSEKCETAKKYTFRWNENVLQLYQ